MCPGFLWCEMRRNAWIVMGTGVLLLGFSIGGSQSVSAGDLIIVEAATPHATGFHIEANRGQAGPLYAQIGGQNIRIAEEAFAAWLMEEGQKVAYSAAADGGGGYENEGQSLRIYDVRARTHRTVLSADYVIDTVSAIKTKSGRQALLVEMRDGGLGASHVAVVDPHRGQVFLRQQVRLLERQGDIIVLGHYYETDWERMTGEIAIRPYKTERHNVSVLIKRPVLAHKPATP